MKKWREFDNNWWGAAGSRRDTEAPGELDSRARVIAIGDASFDATVAGLESYGIEIDADAGFTVLVTRDYLDPAVSGIARSAQNSGLAWMLCRPYGVEQWIGPLFVPGKTPCYECLARTLLTNGWADERVAANPPSTTWATSMLAATEAAKWLFTGANEQMEGRIASIDTTRLRLGTHIVRQRRDCPVCGCQAAAADDLESLVSPLSGIVASCTEIHREAGFVLVQGVGSQRRRTARDGSAWIAPADTYFGSGESGAEARRSCLGEAAERYSCLYHGQPVTFAPLSRLGDGAIDPRSLICYSESQYRGREAWNANHRECDQIGAPFDPDAEIGWAAARWFTSGETVLAPAGYCYLGFTEEFCGADSNGCAAGPDLDTAVLHGLLELIERDAVALWWYNRARRPALDLEGSPRALRVSRSLESRGYRLDVLDLTTDFRVPACVAVCSRHGRGILLDGAAAADAESAIWSAVCGVAGSVATLERGGVWADAQDQEQFESWLREGSLTAEPYLAASNIRRSLDELPSLPGAAVRERLLDCVARVEATGLRVAVLDLTRPETGVPAARVIVPGLRSWRPRFAAGRLYDAPPALGWTPRRLTEAELNPIPFVF